VVFYLITLKLVYSTNVRLKPSVYYDKYINILLLIYIYIYKQTIFSSYKFYVHFISIYNFDTNK